MKIQDRGERGSTWEWKTVSLSSKIQTCPEREKTLRRERPLCVESSWKQWALLIAVSTHLGNMGHTTLQTGVGVSWPETALTATQ